MVTTLVFCVPRSEDQGNLTSKHFTSGWVDRKSGYAALAFPCVIAATALAFPGIIAVTALAFPCIITETALAFPHITALAWPALAFSRITILVWPALAFPRVMVPAPALAVIQIHPVSTLPAIALPSMHSHCTRQVHQLQREAPRKVWVELAVVAAQGALQI